MGQHRRLLQIVHITAMRHNNKLSSIMQLLHTLVQETRTCGIGSLANVKTSHIHFEICTQILKVLSTLLQTLFYLHRNNDLTAYNMICPNHLEHQD